MYNKIIEEEYGKTFKKGYKIDNAYGVINSILDSEKKFEYANVMEDTDIGMQYHSGKYTYKEFAEDYLNMRFEIDRVIFYYDNDDVSIDVMIPANFLVLTTYNPELEVESFIKNNEKEHGGK